MGIRVGLGRAAIAAGIVGALASVGPVLAKATAPAMPTLTSPPHQGFVVGGQIGTSDINQGEPSDGALTYHIPMHLTWTASSNARYFDLVPVQTANCSDVDLITTIDEDTTKTSANVQMSDNATGPCGWGNPFTGYTVIATNPEGSLIGKRVLDGNPIVYQEDGRLPDSNSLDTPISVTYAGTWTNGTCACASGGTQRATVKRGASTTISRSFDAGSHVALVMAKGPGRGKATVSVDGASAKTIDTHAKGTNKNRIIVFDRAMTAGRHTIRVVNQATPGHPRIDLDAVMVS